MATDEWRIWQLADTAFPIGGLAHSNGLEAAWQHGLVVDGPTLDEFIRAGIRQSMRGALLFARAVRSEPKDFIAIDEQCDLFLNSHVSNRASRAQGRSLLAAASRIFDFDSLTELARTVRESRTAAHFAPVFGAVLSSLEITPDQADSLFLFMFARGCLSSAVRLGIIGPLEAQQIQSRLTLNIAWPTSLAVTRASGPCAKRSDDEECGSLNLNAARTGWKPVSQEMISAEHIDDVLSHVAAVQTAPVLDLLQATQDRLYSRLFQS